MSTLTISALFCAFVAIAFAIITASKSTTEKRYRWFSIMCLELALWNLFFFFSRTFYSALLERIHLLMTLILAPTSGYFLLQLTEKIDQKQPTFIKTQTLGYSVGIILALGFFLPDNKLFWFKHGSYTYAVFVIGYAFFLLAQNLRKASLGIQEKKRQTYLIAGGIFTLLMLIFDQLSESGFPLPALGNVVLVIYLYFIYQTITRRKVLDLEDLTAKGVLFFILSAILTIIYVILVSWVEGSALFLFNTFVASFVILILFEPVKTLTQKVTYNFFLQGRLKTEEQLDRIKNILIDITNLNDLTHEVLVGLKNALKATQAHFFLLDPEGTKFKLIQSLAPDPSKVNVTEVLANHDFIKYLQRKNPLPASTYFLNREILEGSQGIKEKLLQATQMFSAFNTEVAFPFMLEGKILGFCTFTNELSDTAYSLQELRLLIPLSKQIAYTLKNLEIYDTMRERDRLATLGEMSAGLAHEIRNPLGAIKGAAQYLLPSTEQSSQNDFLKIIVDEVDRLNKVVTQFLTYAKPFQQNFIETDASELIKKSLQNMAASTPPSILISYEENSKLPLMMADPQQLNQVFLNLILNAFDAMPKGGKLKIHTKVVEPNIQIIFEDTGEGIVPENLKNLFIPFFTTKKEGSGLGLPICQKIIKAHQGNIKVESTLQKGTKFIMTFPYKKQ